MGKKQRQVYEAIIAKPDRKDVDWDELLSLILYLGGTVRPKRGSAHGIKLNGEYPIFHRPHPGNQIYLTDLKRIRRYLRKAGITHVEKKMMKYKDYVGKVEYNDVGKIFTGEVVGIRAVITFEGRTPEELEQSFRESIDIYLDMCEQDGINPEKPYSGRFNVRIPPELHREIAYQAANERKSLNDWVMDAFYKAQKNRDSS